MKYEDYIGFNLDATTTDRLQIRRVESLCPCELCNNIRSTPILPNHPDPHYYTINQPFCPCNRVKIDWVVYNRSRIYSSYMSMNMDYDTKESRCRGCGVPAGFIHHIGCTFDTCPKCHNDDPVI